MFVIARHAGIFQSKLLGYESIVEPSSKHCV